MDPLTLAVGVGTAAAVGVGTGLRLRQRLRRAEATAAGLRRELEAEQYAANHDSLTGLPNRRSFYRLGHRLVADPIHPAIACVVVDLNSFKQINDTLGHAAGDEVLVTVARRLARYGGAGTEGNLVARLGGDEFAGLFSHPRTDWALLYPAADGLADLLAAPMPVAGRELRVTASVGAAAITREGGLAFALRQADSAMYRAKATGSRATCYNPVLDDDAGSAARGSMHTRDPGGGRHAARAVAAVPAHRPPAARSAGPPALPLPTQRPPAARTPVDAGRSRGA